MVDVSSGLTVFIYVFNWPTLHGKYNELSMVGQERPEAKNCQSILTSCLSKYWIMLCVTIPCVTWNSNKSNSKIIYRCSLLNICYIPPHFETPKKFDIHVVDGFN